MHFLENDFHIKGIERVGAMVGENDFEGTPPHPRLLLALLLRFTKQNGALNYDLFCI